MTAITVLEISTADMPFTVVNGTKKRRKIIAVRGNEAGNADMTLDLDTYVNNLDTIEGLMWETVDSATVATTTWNAVTKVLTFVGASGAADGYVNVGVLTWHT